MIWLSLLLFCPVAWSHVALTFPPARNYDLDFLDSFRTSAPCGMPKGNIRTTIPAGKKFAVTWHLGYPHQGGFRIEVLDAQERPLMNLTTGDLGFVVGDTTAQSYEVTLPRDMVCRDCTIKLLRQALEFGRRYQFWSCSDVDIIPSQEYREKCSDRGRASSGQCVCDSRFHGDRCQYENECEDDRDCGKYGKCIDIDATTYPKKQCFCEHGYFGAKCNIPSPLKDTNMNLDSYSQRRLSDDYIAYWRILENVDEIEVVLKMNGTGYAALGWKPLGLPSRCQWFPYIAEAHAETEPESEAEGHAETEPESEAEGHAETEPESEAEGHAETEPESEAEGHAETESEAEGHAETEPESEAEGHAETEPESEAEGHAETEPESEAYGKNEPEPEGHAESERESETEPEGGAGVRKSDQGPRRSRYTPRSRIHAMDCTDIVIGMARGPYSRVMDYYTRDRSTPKVDSFWNGKDDLTAAVGQEEDGITTIAFRKRLTGNEPSDHSIIDNLMTVIWAKGQEQNNYIHRPNSGLERGEKSVENFYRPDELKYHGHGTQRGVVTLNFMEASSDKPNSNCGGEWKHPMDCIPPSCEYRAAWEYEQETDSVAFTIQTTNTDKWTGIGFSEDQRMPKTDAVLGWVDRSGRHVLEDVWIDRYTRPRLDNNRSIDSVDVKVIDGVTTVQFKRKRDTGDEQDLNLSNQCVYFIFPVKGGSFNSISKAMNYHEETPSVSAERICIQSCGVGNRAIDSPGSDLNRRGPQQQRLSIEIELLGERESEPFSMEFQRRVKRAIKGVVEDVPGFQNIDKLEFERSRMGGVFAKTQVLFHKQKQQHKFEEALKEKVQGKFEEVLSTGEMGGFRVNPQYLKVTIKSEAEYGEPEGEHEGEPESEAEYGEPEGEHKGDPESEAEYGEPEGEHEGEPESEAEYGEPEGEHEGDPESEAEYGEPEGEHEGDPESEAEYGEPEGEHEGEPESEAEYGEPEGEHEGEPESEAEYGEPESEGEYIPGQYFFHRPTPNYDDYWTRRGPSYHRRPFYRHYSHPRGSSERYFHPLVAMIQRNYNNNYYTRKHNLLKQWARENGYEY